MFDFELGGNPLISIKLEYNNCHSTADKYRFLLYIEKELKSKYKEIEDYPGYYQNEQSNYDEIKEWLITEFEYIEKISKTDIETYSQEREGIIQPDKNKAAEFYKCDWNGIFNWDYDEIVNYANERYETIHEKINFFNQVISYSKLGDEYYEKAAFETDEMKKKKELRRLLKLKIKELELRLKYPEKKDLDDTSNEDVGVGILKISESQVSAKRIDIKKNNEFIDPIYVNFTESSPVYHLFELLEQKQWIPHYEKHEIAIHFKNNKDERFNEFNPGTPFCKFNWLFDDGAFCLLFKELIYLNFLAKSYRRSYSKIINLHFQNNKGNSFNKPPQQASEYKKYYEDIALEIKEIIKKTMKKK